MISPDPVLESIVESAAGATGAAAGWILDVDGDDLVVVAVTGSTAAKLLGERVPGGGGSAGFVVASGQPLAVAPRPGDEMVAEGVIGLTGIHPSSVLSVPCATNDMMQGAMELIDKVGALPFTFDDVEVATLLAGVAGPALAYHDSVRVEIPTPEELSGLLARLASGDPVRYARAATLVKALLDQH